MVNYFRQPYNPNRIPMQNNEHLMNQDNKIYWIIGIFILLLMGVLVYIIFVSPFQKDDSLKTDKGDINKTQFSQQTSQIPISCKIWDCFIYASKNCERSNFTFTKSLDLFGANFTSTMYYELKGLDNAKCIFYLKMEEEHMDYTEETIQQMLESGNTKEEIEQMKEEMNEQIDLIEGKDGQCKIRTDDLTVLLTKWKNGDSEGGVFCQLTSERNNCEYTGDWEVFTDCEGDYFDQN